MVDRSDIIKKAQQTDKGQRGKWGTTIQKMTEGESGTHNRDASGCDIWNYIVSISRKTKTQTYIVLAEQ